jgi:hypothetical protein
MMLLLCMEARGSEYYCLRAKPLLSFNEASIAVDAETETEVQEDGHYLKATSPNPKML